MGYTDRLSSRACSPGPSFSMIGSIGLPILVDVGLRVRLGSTQPRSPSVSFESFDLDARVRAGIQAAGYQQPTPIQQQSIPPILAGHDLLGIAQTGTGTTAAFILPILQRLLANPGRGGRALILAPTRELAEQIHQATRVYGKRTGVRSVAIYGGGGKPKQGEGLRRGGGVVIARPRPPLHPAPPPRLHP